jgi:DNA-binding NtrC family response regulator
LLLAIGAVVRRRDIKRHGHRIDVTLVRWIYACSAVIVAGMSAAVAWVIHDPESFVGGGFRPIIAVTMAGGSGCIMMALARHEIGAHVRTLQRGASVLLVAGIATALLIPILVALGAARNVVDGGQLVVAAIGIAGIAMALVGARLQRAFDARDAAVRDRAARQSAQDLDAAHSKVASLEQHLADLQKRIEDSRPPGLRKPSRPLIGDGLRGTYELVDRVAPADTTVLIVGETGVGKEVIAKAIHTASTRSQRPFVVIDCFAAENHLFEDAIRKADTGTVFLDEVCDLSLDLQSKLARIIETPEALDTRIIAGTNRDLERMVADGMFRAELFYRLRVFEIAVPPLRARRQDIAPLAVSFLAAAGARARSLTPEALEVLHAHHWPGNVRELRHVIEAAALVCDGDALRATDLRIDRDVFRSKAREALSKSGPDTGLRETLSTLERERLERALAEHQGNQSAAAKALGMSRPALRRRLARYAIQGQASTKR